MHLPEMEEAVKEMPGGDIILSASKKMAKKYGWSQDTYMSTLKEWMENQFAKPANESVHATSTGEVKPINLKTDPKHLLKEENRFDKNVYTPEDMIRKGYNKGKPGEVKTT
jgi:hypothetical protein